MNYGIGLDCGITSVGWSVMQLDRNDDPCKIIKLGSRIFPAAEVPKTGASLAAPRREARGARRRIRRHQHRLERIRYMLVRKNILSEEELLHLFDGQLTDIYELRTKALDSALTPNEFARVLYHIAQRRGFKSNRKNNKSDKEAGKLLNAVEENTKLIASKNYRTVGEMFYKDAKYSQYKRNKAESYICTVSRAMIANEISKIFEAQRSFGNKFAAEEIEKEYTDIVLSQRPFDLGPGEGNENSPSRYAGNQIEKMIGECSLIEGEKRAAKACYSFEYFSLLQKTNHIRIAKLGQSPRKLTDVERKSVVELCHKTQTVKYNHLRKLLNLTGEETFAGIAYGKKTLEEAEKQSFNPLKAYHQIRKALDKLSKGYIKKLSVEQLNDIGYIFTVYKTDSDLKTALQSKGFSELEQNQLVSYLDSFKNFGHISIKACNMLIPHLELGLTYDKACLAAGIDFKGHQDEEKNFLLQARSPYLETIVNPVVRRAVSQTIKVINAIIREQGASPTYINIELARELSKSHDDRLKMHKSMEDNRARNEAIIERLQKEFKINIPTGMDIVKLKLWEEQDGICPYSQKSIDINRLFDVGYVDIDHIVPYSISFDDSYRNKVLVLSEENRQKGNRLPLEYLQGQKRENFIVWVNTSVHNRSKKQKLLKEHITAEDTEGFKKRNLEDTQYLSRVLYNYIKDTLLFTDYQNGGKRHVFAVNGQATAYLRKRWGIRKIREDGDLHHAVDATVIACATNSLIQRISAYSKYREVEYIDTEEYSVAVDGNGEVIDEFPQPYHNFRKELEARTMDHAKQVVKDCKFLHYTKEDEENVTSPFVSRMPNHKATGPAHDATIRSGKKEKYLISKTPLAELKLDKNGEIKDYYNKSSDLLLYNALKDRLQAFGGKAEKAFPPDFVFHKPKANGEEGPVVKKVKIEKKSSANVLVRGDSGVAENGSMIRIDIFKIENDGYYFVPIYVADTVKSREDFPNKAVARGSNGWKEMDDKDFLFSLYPNDLVKIEDKKPMKFTIQNKDSLLSKEILRNNILLYYNNADIATASITLVTNDNAYKLRGKGIKSLKSIEKYTVDVLGNVQKVEKEKRMYFK